MRNAITACLFLASIAFLYSVPSKAELSIAYGHLYATSGETITQYSDTGAPVAMLMLPEGTLRGIAVYGHDRLLVVQSRNSPALPRLLTVDRNGEVIARRDLPGGISGNISSGKIHVTRSGAILIATASAVLRLATPDAFPESFLPGGYDVTELPDGSLVVAEEYTLARYSPDGTFIGEVSGSVNASGAPATRFTNLRGVHWSDQHQTLYATMLGHSGDTFRIIAMSAVGYVELRKVSHHYADDLIDAAGGDLAVGSRTLAPSFYDSALRLRGAVSGPAAHFVAAVQRPIAIMANGFE